MANDKPKYEACPLTDGSFGIFNNHSGELSSSLFHYKTHAEADHAAKALTAAHERGQRRLASAE